MRFQRFPLGERLARDHRCAENDIAVHHATREAVGKAQHIGRRIAASIAAVQDPRFGCSDDPHRDFSPFPECCPGPTADLRWSGNPDGARYHLKMERETLLSWAAEKRAWGGVGRAAGPHGAYPSP